MLVLLLSPLVMIHHMKLWSECQTLTLTNVAIAKLSSLQSREDTTAGMHEKIAYYWDLLM